MNACVEQTLVATKHIDVLVNNAGIVAGRSLLALSPSQIRQTFGVNTFAHFWLMQAVLPSMLRNTERDALIVTVSSVVRRLLLPGGGAVLFHSAY